ncbi:MAG: TfoX/Sxy family protein [Anaerolineaceae bacterium]|nr:TfoX/Sxy family protein [Anaerolineaceae bacterium]
MASSQDTIDFLMDQISSAGEVSARKMFGEYGIYCDGKMPALVCDNQLYIKPTEEGRAYIGEVEEAPPYQGAKPYFLISGDKWDDQEWLSELIRITAEVIPYPKKKKKASAKTNKA